MKRASHRCYKQERLYREHIVGARIKIDLGFHEGAWILASTSQHSRSSPLADLRIFLILAATMCQVVGFSWLLDGLDFFFDAGQTMFGLFIRIRSLHLATLMHFRHL